MPGLCIMLLKFLIRAIGIVGTFEQKCVFHYKLSYALTALALASLIEQPAEEPVENEIEKRVWSYANIDPYASSGAKELLKYLQSQFGWHYISGLQDPMSLAWVRQNIGKTPAILGNDSTDYSPSRVAYGATSHAVEDAESFNNQGGISTFVWHWNAPTYLYNTASESWYYEFYTTELHALIFKRFLAKAQMEPTTTY
jgi:hypothetical protein